MNKHVSIKNENASKNQSNTCKQNLKQSVVRGKSSPKPRLASAGRRTFREQPEALRGRMVEIFLTWKEAGRQTDRQRDRGAVRERNGQTDSQEKREADSNTETLPFKRIRQIDKKKF